MTGCQNCNDQLNSPFCPTCGRASKLKRIDGHYIIHEIEHVLHFEKGILYTILGLLTKPGESVRNFFFENRSRLVKPIIFIIITSLLYTIVTHFFHLEDGYIKYDEVKKSATILIFKWVQDHYGYSNIIMGAFIALWIKILFKKHNYNFFEILILLCFVMGMGMLFFTIFAIFQVITHIELMQAGGIIGFLYAAWAIGQFFGKEKFTNYLKALAAYILGFITFSLSAILLGKLIDLII
ncbi:DUF3667 domain-containing protein [Pedobacter changchengzhani]|uniref:DUF3667 domain-containing protein n=1 Tax=Pedobacter changchengzhani TaxID=2529274 RepID=A0A4R5MHR5_9SPHI|nr:DUF3667 domain-containing protein [Pedobacter changchengzhani]TDG35074.1 DUF3667 domain-containing protein [Pedobacter changchengzhani]